MNSKYVDIKSPAQLAVALEEGRVFLYGKNRLFYDKDSVNPFRCIEESGNNVEIHSLWIHFDTLIELIEPDIFEYIFEGAIVIGKISDTEYRWHKYLGEFHLRLPTIEETPTNTKMLWHPSLGMPEGLDDYCTVIVWYRNGPVLYGSSYNQNWNEVIAFMIVE